MSNVIKLKVKIPTVTHPNAPANDVEPVTGLLYNLEDPTEFAAWCVHYPKAASLLSAVIRSWKTSHAKLKGDKHTWAAYSLSAWSKWTDLKPRTLKYYFKMLAEYGLIRRKKSIFAGNVITTYIRPTRLALLHSDAGKAKKPTTSPAPDYVTTWESAMIAHDYLAHCVLTKTERGQLAEAVASMPSEYVTSIIEYALANWSMCVQHAAEMSAEFNLPEIPTPKFFKNHIGIFINVYLQAEKGQD